MKCIAVICAALALVVVAAGSASALPSTARLTAFGALKRDWLSRHVSDPNPKLNRGCCFLPKQADGQDRYYAVDYGSYAPGGRVDGYEMAFVPPVNQALAIALLQREAPSDARLVRIRKRPGCAILSYASPTLKRLKVGTLTAALYRSGASDAPYTGTVGTIILLNFSSSNC